jgi:hypothetical protein
VLLYRQRNTVPADDASTNSGPTFDGPSQAAERLRSGIATARATLADSLYRTAQSARRQLRRLVPSRRQVLRTTCFIFGANLVVLSLFGFLNGRILESSIILPIGYALAASMWLLPWTGQRTGPDAEEVAYLAAADAPASGTAEPAPRQSPPRAKIAGPKAPPVSVAPASATVDNRSAPEAAPVPLAFATGKAGQLKCTPCGKQYNVRGDGDVGLRLIPCPQCGAALESGGARTTVATPADPTWVPIVSVACKACRGLIDVPYSTFGTSIPCPRCHSNLTVPRIVGAH